MLRELSVQNLALIEDVRVELQAGFCAWTGETGAGKTLLLSALGLLLGERGSSDLIRADASELRIVGSFELALPGQRAAVEDALGFPLDDDQVILMRRLNRQGRSFAYVNEQPVAVGTLRQVGVMLVDIHGQRDSYSLLEPAHQLLLLDAFGDLDEPRQHYLDIAAELRRLRERRATLLADRQQRQRELSLLRFEREELDAAELQAGELAALAQERERLAHAQSLTAFAEDSCAKLYDEDGSVYEVVGKLLRAGEDWVRLDRELEEAVKRLDALAEEVKDLAETLRHLATQWQADPQRREQVEDRLQLLRKLEGKYARKIDDLIAYRGTLDERERQLQQREDDLETLEGQVRREFARLLEAGLELRAGRQKAARSLAREVQKHLADLGMKEAKLEAALAPLAVGDDPLTAPIPSHGLDEFELLLAANLGEPKAPLRKVASGGELSRTMLALKSVLAAQDVVGTLIFDEIDANVGGRLGDVLGEKLAALGRAHQVICVTHLPQVASYARAQWTIRKTKRGKRTVTTIERLEDEERLDELASMLRGESKTESTRQEAAAMLETARKRW